jgi:hypothetical protein
VTEDENAMKAAAQCVEELRDSDVPCQELMEPRSGSASLAAKIRGWQQTLEALERGELSNSEVEVILRTELPRALSENIESAMRGAETKDADRLGRVLAKVVKALERRVKALGPWQRTRRWPSRRRSR